MKSEKLEYWSKGVMGGQGVVESCGDEAFLIEGKGKFSLREAGFWEVGLSGQRRGFIGFSGQEMGKWTGSTQIAPGFSRVDPDNSTQVVDFPHLSTAGSFGSMGKTAETPRRRAKRSLEPRLGSREEAAKKQRHRGGTEGGVQTEIVVVKVEKGVSKRGGGGFWRKMVVLNYTYLHAFTRFYTMFLSVNVTSDEIRGKPARFAYPGVASSGVSRSRHRLSPPFAAICRLLAGGGW